MIAPIMSANDSNSAAPRSSSARSCTTCAKAKAKCVREPQQSICDRCARLNKECHLKEPIARRRRSTKTSRAAQLEKLESKIEHLVHALSVQQPRGGEYRSQLSPPLSTSDLSQSANVQATKGILAHVTSSRNTTPEAMSPDATRTPDSLPSTGGCCGAHPALPSLSDAIVISHNRRTLSVTMYDAEILLNRYQRLMAPTFPFVVVPSGINAAMLYNLKPFLLQAIITAASFHDIIVQREMMKDCLRDVTERIFMKGEKSIDLLEGLLVLIAWYHPHVFWSQQTSNLLHLALAMVIDLAIDRPAGMCEEIKGSDCHPRSDTTASLAMNSQLTDARILAGVFYLSSVFSCCFKRADPKPYSKVLVASLELLEKTQEFPNDLLLVRMTRLQHLMEEANSFDVSLPSTHLHIKTLLAELGRFRSNVGAIEDDVLLHLQYGITEVCILELALFRLQEDKSASVREHVDHIYRLAAAIQKCVDIFATLPHSSFLALPFPVFGEFAHCLITMARLFALDIDGLRGRDLRETVRYNEIMVFAINRFATANQTKPDGLNVRNDSFLKWSHRLKFMQQAFEPKLPIQSGSQANGPPPSSDTTSQTRTDSFDTASFSQGVSLATTPADDVLLSDFFNTLDDNFWSSFRGDLDLGFADVQMS